MIDARALVSPQAELAADVTVGPYAVIGPQVRIGARTRVAGRPQQTLTEDDEIDGEDVVPGFRMSVRAVFADPMAE